MSSCSPQLMACCLACQLAGMEGRKRVAKRVCLLLTGAQVAGLVGHKLEESDLGAVVCRQGKGQWAGRQG